MLTSISDINLPFLDSYSARYKGLGQFQSRTYISNNIRPLKALIAWELRGLAKLSLMNLYCLPKILFFPALSFP